MAAVLQFSDTIPRDRRAARAVDGADQAPECGGQVIIFPGVRIERPSLDLAHRRVRINTYGGSAGSTTKSRS